LDLCDQDTRLDDGVFERFSVHEFQECVDRTSLKACSSLKDSIETLPDQKHSCECKSTDTNAVSMKCKNGCSLCNKRGNICAREKKIWNAVLLPVRALPEKDFLSKRGNLCPFQFV
jgi:hypothetical protein